MELPHDGRLGGVVHGGVAPVPGAQHPQAAELLALLDDPLVGIDPAGGAELGLGHLVLGAAPGAELLLDLPLDGQAVAVPAGGEVHVVAQHQPGADHEVLQDLVQGMADVDRAVGVGRAVVQHEQGPAVRLPLRPGGAIEVDVGPAGQDLGLELGQPRPHGEGGLGQEHRVAVVASGGGGLVVGHGAHSRIGRRRARGGARAGIGRGIKDPACASDLCGGPTASRRAYNSQGGAGTGHAQPLAERPAIGKGEMLGATGLRRG